MNRVFRALEIIIAGLLAGMVLMVFGNVVLRYGFNSGITVSEELSRVFFVWLTFIGAIVAMREGGHLGMSNVVERLSRRGKLICTGICQLLIIMCCMMLVWGTWRQHEVSATTKAAVTQMSMIWVFGITYVTGTAMTLLAAHKFWRIVSGQIRDDELIEISAEEELRK